jgi:hypothetical protein
MDGLSFNCFLLTIDLMLTSVFLLGSDALSQGQQVPSVDLSLGSLGGVFSFVSMNHSASS